MAVKKYILTDENRAELEAELRDLIDVQRPDVIAKLQLARSQGDLSENADYDAARDRQSQIESRILEIEAILNNSVSADEAQEKKGAIGIGDVVEIEDGRNGRVFEVKITGNTGANPMAVPPVVSNESPLGKALLGSGKGKTVTVEAEKPYEIKIIRVNGK